MYRINTYYGHTIDYIKPDSNEIDIRDIAHNLSFENRFIGQTAEPYSGLSTVYLVAMFLKKWDCLSLHFFSYCTMRQKPT